MKLLNDIRNYIEEDSYKIILTKSYINIINFTELKNISDKKIVLNLLNKNLNIIGNNLKIIKLLDEEILIEGTITELYYD